MTIQNTLNWITLERAILLLSDQKCQKIIYSWIIWLKCSQNTHTATNTSRHLTPARSHTQTQIQIYTLITPCRSAFDWRLFSQMCWIWLLGHILIEIQKCQSIRKYAYQMDLQTVEVVSRIYFLTKWTVRT